MNKIILLGRLVRTPEIRYSNNVQPMTIAHYTLAVNRKYKRDGEQNVDFVDCVAFRKNAETAQKWLTKGKQIVVIGNLQIRTYEDKNGNKRKVAEVVVEEQHFVGNKSDADVQDMATSPEQSKDGFYPINEDMDDDDMPF